MSIDAIHDRRRELLLPLVMMLVGIIGPWLLLVPGAMALLEDHPLWGVLRYLPWGMTALALVGMAWSVYIIVRTDSQ